MSNYSKFFNPKKSSFYLADNDSADLSEVGGNKITKAYLAGYKANDLSGLAELFPNLTSLTIDPNNKLTSLEGIEKMNLESLSLMHCVSLTDYSQLATQRSLKEFNALSAPAGTQVLIYLVKNITTLSIDPNDPQIELVSKMSKLKYLSFSCDQCELSTLPILPATLQSLTIEGDYPNLKDASFMVNLKPETNLNLWFDFSGLKNIPERLKDNDAFS